MSRNEKTSARVAKIAAKVLACSASPNRELFHYYEQYSAKRVSIMWSDIRALAASALTQAPDLKSKIKPPVIGRVRNVTGPARIKSKRPSSWPPSAKPKRRSP